MPKLSKIRLTNCKYDGLRKEHQDSIFDLTKGKDPSHVLFTLANGGGKGVMMQFIFQILLPETRWGKNNGNKIISTFYDHRGNPNYFTSHIVLEWVLDTIPERRLITGMAMKPMLKNIDMEEEDTGLYYFLYTCEQGDDGYFTIENLPLYDERTGESIDIDEFENFIDANKRDFIKYSKSSVKRIDGDYYKFLESRGIYKGEWSNLKTINKSEGGAGDFFSGASDNKTIFDKIIIPALSENIRNYNYDNGDNLVEMFKSNLSITKDLPILIQREKDYKALIEEITPLVENADSGSRFIDRKNRLIQEGNDIYFILRDEFNKVNKEIEKWEREKQKAELERKELEFKKDVIAYNGDLKEIQEKGEEHLKLCNELEEKIKNLEEHKKNLKIYKINRVLYNKNKVEEEIKIKNIEKENLIKNLEITDIENKKEEIDQEIFMELDRVKIQWQSIEGQYIGYENYCKMNMEENKHRKRKLSHRKGQMEHEINIFQLKKENLERGKEDLEKYYDPMSLAFPERILEELLENKQDLEGEILTSNEKIEKYKENLNGLNREIERLEYTKINKERELKELRSKIIEREKWELEVAKSLCSQLLEEYDGSLLNHNWFKNKGEQLKILEKEKQDDLEKIQKILWEKNLNKALSREEYFVPNQDVFKIREEIKALGIHVETGVEFLEGLNKEDRRKTLEDFPEILYSLIIASLRDWELIERNIGNSLFLNNLVPIYIRKEMHSGKRIFKNLGGRAYELIDLENYHIWKESINREINDLVRTMERIKGDLDNINKLQQELNHISRIDTAFLLNRQYREEEKSIIEILEEIRRKEEEKLSFENRIHKHKNHLEKLEEELGGLEKILGKVELYTANLKEFREEEGRILRIKEEVKDLDKDIYAIDLDSGNIREELDELKDAFRDWKFNRDNIVEELKNLFPSLETKYNLDYNYSSPIIPNFEIHGEFLLSKIRERKALDKEISDKNYEIQLIDIRIENKYNELDRYIAELNKLDKNWMDTIPLDKGLNEINIEINLLEKNIINLEKDNANLKSNIDILQGSITQMKKTLEAKERTINEKHSRPPVILDIKDILGAMDMVDRDLASNENYHNICKDGLERNEKLISRIEVNLSKIKSQYELDIMKGKKDNILKEKLDNNIDLVVDEWFNKYDRNKRQINATLEEGERYRNNFLKVVETKLEEDRLKRQILATIKEANIINFKNNLISFTSMKNHFQNEILSLSRDKEKAEEAMKQWTHRASIHVIRMVEALKDMVNSMNYINEAGHSFPLVKLKGVERLPREENDILYLLEEYFIASISEIINSNKDIENLDNRELNRKMGDGAIFSKALQGRYPTLLVYKMSEKNEFKYTRPRDEYYTSWEAIMKGEGYAPEGSGGQTLSITTFLIMMIMSFKKKHLGNENPSTVLILDNPFGKASGKHVLDPIFEIADKLNFQLICFAAPEIIKAEISERFPVFWDLKIEDGKIVHGGRIIKEGYNDYN